ncbi:hypothetical protein Bbelb_403420 [Branchiostoma belcheri]|nr:hypothetical protein Bbelb_403420 [Branchiostoma belcheri]
MDLDGPTCTGQPGRGYGDTSCNCTAGKVSTKPHAPAWACRRYDLPRRHGKSTAGRITSQADSKSKTTARLSRNMHGEPCQIARRHPASLAKDARFFILVEASRAPVGRCPRSLPDRRGLSANGSEGLLHMNRLVI